MKRLLLLKSRFERTAFFRYFRANAKQVYTFLVILNMIVLGLWIYGGNAVGIVFQSILLAVSIFGFLVISYLPKTSPSS